jgi:hypothetical protein
MAEPAVKVARFHSICAVALCRSNEKSGVMFHRFPKEDQVCQKWVTVCKRKDKFKPATAHMCSLHFGPDAYRRDLYAKLTGKPAKKRLKESAVPSVLLRNDSLQAHFLPEEKNAMAISSLLTAARAATTTIMSQADQDSPMPEVDMPEVDMAEEDMTELVSISFLSSPFFDSSWADEPDLFQDVTLRSW